MLSQWRRCPLSEKHFDDILFTFKQYCKWSMIRWELILNRRFDPWALQSRNALFIYLSSTERAHAFDHDLRMNYITGPYVSKLAPTPKK